VGGVLAVEVCPVHAVATSVFVGREAELGVLHDAFVEASAGRSQVLVVEGEGGIGKTTLVERFLEVVFDTGLTIFTYTADPGTRSAEALSLLGSLAATTAAEQPTPAG
jgi:MoxR-like ATPase